MSSIWGIISKSSDISETAAQLMRSPYETKCKLDRIRTIHNSRILFACGIQHITREAEQELLPLFDAEQQIYFTADCLLDNRAELMQELSLTNNNLADGTIMYEAYKKWGIDCLLHFRGLFSLAVYDAAADILYLAADPTSSRCLYYYHHNEQFCFSTLLDPICSVYPDIKINELYIKDFLTAPGMMPNLVSGETPFQNVFQLNPGCYLTFHSGICEEHTYWQAGMYPVNYHCHSAKGYAKAFRKLYSECVSDALRTSADVAISLSSGLDSSSVAALAALDLQHRKKNLYSYTYIPSLETPAPQIKYHYDNEADAVLELTSMYPCIKPSFLTNDGKNCILELSMISDVLEIPYKASVNMPSLNNIYQQAYQQGCRIVLSGQYGNSTVSYGQIENILYDLFLKKRGLKYLHDLNNYCLSTKQSRIKAAKNCYQHFTFARKKLSEKREFQLSPENRFVSSEILNHYPYEQRYAQIADLLTRSKLPESADLYHSCLHMRAAFTYIGAYETKLGLANGILIRDPTRDSRMLQFCYQLPFELFAHNGTPRWLIRGALRDLLPTSYVNTWPRYGLQNSDWFARIRRDWSMLYPLLKSNFDDTSQYGFQNAAAIQSYLNNFITQTMDSAEIDMQQLLYLYSAALFYKRSI